MEFRKFHGPKYVLMLSHMKYLIWIMKLSFQTLSKCTKWLAWPSTLTEGFVGHLPYCMTLELEILLEKQLGGWTKTAMLIICDTCYDLLWTDVAFTEQIVLVISWAHIWLGTLTFNILTLYSHVCCVRISNHTSIV